MEQINFIQGKGGQGTSVTACASAMRRHRVSRPQVRHVIDHAGLIFLQPPPAGSPLQDHRLVYPGDDQAGVPIEVTGSPTMNRSTNSRSASTIRNSSKSST